MIMKIGIIHLFYISVLILASCQSEPDDMKPVGNWYLYEADMDSVLLSQSFIERAKATLESSNFNFQTNKNFEIVDMSFSGGSFTGIWDYSAEKKKLTLFYPDFHIDPEEYEVIKLTRRTMIIKLKVESYGFFVYKLRKIKE